MKQISCLLFLLLPLQVVAQINEGKLITKNGYFEIPVTETRKEFHITASLKGDSYDFLMDTGAPAFISEEVQDKYKFKLLRRITAKDASGKKIQTTIVSIDTVRFGPFILTDIPAVVLDLKNSPLGCYNLGGNIGSNILRHLIVQFDIRKNIIAVTDNEQLLKQHLRSPQHMKVNQQSDIFFPVKINDDITDTIHFDSGDGVLYEISKRAAEKYATTHPGDIIRKGYGTISMGVGGVGNEFQQYLFKPQSMQVGGSSISGGTISIAGNNISRMGRELLNYGILQLNYPDSTYAFQPYTPAYVCNTYNYGFKPIIDEENVLAGCVWENTTAEREGMSSGDQILKIDNTEFSTLPKCDIEPALRKVLLNDAATISITFKHKKQKPKTITLEKKVL